ncbi:hypothetical protein FZ934_16990 [Rhizobium grahamii]|uniref:Uncharacterized protein n=1 Tax=Rhizobium grahamii TaxID=1120045 RepID=A0A5Q0CDE7_9HYPH|nr:MULTISPECIES: hypothetical protein [Rhizobium]QFY61941.1 hypothetical protein FZ934_16990 [Rhizobium grahamii]QRM48883.1 hypothetical protein F3Y33_05905 [Rhizobium sp. BG6]
MLTPVRAASNASFSSQSPSVAIAANGTIRVVDAVPPVHQVQSSDLNSTIAGKLNILLLAVRARMVEALLDVLKAAGDALSQPRGDDETDLAFASRLASAIQKLPPAKIEQLERQLAAQGHAVPLRLLAEALKNPAGPEAARITAYLESMRYKDRDLATGAVVRSYRQNDASPLRQEQKPEINLQRETLSNASPDDMEPSAPAAASVTGRPASEAEQPHQATPVPQQSAVILEAADAPVVQPEAIVDLPDDEQIPTAARTETEMSTPGSVGEDVAIAAPDVAASRTGTKADPVIPKIWPGIPASITEETTDLIVAIIRDQETDTLLDAADGSPVEIDVLAGDALATDLPDDPVELPVQTLAQSAARQSTLVNPQPAAALTDAAVRQAQEQVEQHDVPDAVEAAYAPILMRIVEGVPYAPRSYDFAKDEIEDGGSHSMNREDHDGGMPSEDEEEAPDEEGQPEPEAVVMAENSEAASADEKLGSSSVPPLAAPGLAMPQQTEEAYALYRRMAGWE